MRGFWRKRVEPGVDERVEARKMLASNEARVQRLRDEAAIITLRLPKVKRAS